MRALRRGAAVAVLAAVGIGVAIAAGSARSAASGDGREPLAVTCRDVACSGTIDGAAYRIELPARWNGSLILWFHGYQPVVDLGTKRPVRRASAGPSAAAVERLLGQGYVLAGSAYASDGWAVADGMAAGAALHRYVVDNVGKPRRTYVWGESMGGLVAASVAEAQTWVDGAALECAPLGGVLRKVDRDLDVAWAVRQLLAPQMQVTSYANSGEATTALSIGRRALQVASTTSEGRARLAVVGAVADLPAALDDSLALVTAIGAVLDSSTTKRVEIEQRVGGNPSANLAADYGRRLDPAERFAVDAIAPGAVDRALARLGPTDRVAADPAARQRAGKLGVLAGTYKRPTVTLHALGDAVVPVQHERVAADGAPGGQLAQVFVRGGGHCTTTTGEQVGLLDVLDGWVRSGHRPSPKTLAAVSPRSIPGYRPGPWPSSTDRSAPATASAATGNDAAPAGASPKADASPAPVATAPPR